MSRVVLFGVGAFAEVARFYLTHDSEHEVVGFSVHRDRLDGTEFLGLPVVAFEEIESVFSPSEHEMFIAVGYARVNQVRAAIYAEAKARGYSLITYVSSKLVQWGDTKIGDNCFIFENQTIQPFVTIGNDVIIWSGNHIGHHSAIGDHCFITSHTVISGFTKIGSYSFVGVNSTLSDNIEIGESNIIGAGSIIMKSTLQSQVFVPERTKLFPKPSG